LVAEELGQSVGTGVGDRLETEEVSGDGPGAAVLPEVGEGVDEAGQVDVEVVADLAAQAAGLVDQAAPEADETEEFGPEFVPGEFGEGEAVEGGAEESVEVPVVGLVIGIGDLAELFSGERVDDAGVEVGGGEGALDEAVVAAGAFDDNKEVAEVVVAGGLSELLDGLLEGRAVMVEALGWKEYSAEIVHEHPFGIGFMAIEAGDTEVGGSGLFDAVVEVTAGLV
jgi:hypothetical protein